MEGWLYGLFTLVGVLAGGLFTYLGMRKQLEQQSEIDSRQRRREIRSEPLLKLRNELARMANKQDKLVAAAFQQRTRFGVAGDKMLEELQEAIDDWRAYLAGGDLAQTLFIQYDADLVNRVGNIRRDYQKSYVHNLYVQPLDEKQFSKAMKVFGRNRDKIIEVQELINKRLEEL